MLFVPLDRVAFRMAGAVPVHGGSDHGKPGPQWQYLTLPRDQAIERIVREVSGEHRDLQCSAGTHDGSGSFCSGSHYCCVRAVLLHLEHGEGKPYRDVDDIRALVGTHPAGLPTAAWEAGGEVQLLFRLDRPVDCGSDAYAELERAWERLRITYDAGDGNGAGHFFPVPFSGPGAQEGATFRDQILHWEPGQAWTVRELAAVAHPYMDQMDTPGAAGQTVCAQGWAGPAYRDQGPDAVCCDVRDIGLADCRPLRPEVGEKLRAYCDIHGLKDGQATGKMRETARFFDHVARTHGSGVLLAPCGTGKTSWALCLIAAGAPDGNRRILVVETISRVHELAGALESLTEVPVGRLHAFDAETCGNLRRAAGLEFNERRYTWRNCNPEKTESPCHACGENVRCVMYRRAEEEEKPVLVMTHAGLVSLMERGSGILQGADVIIDEALDVYADWVVEHRDLERVQQCSPDPVDWTALFPYSRAAVAHTGADIHISKGARTYAARNFVFMEGLPAGAGALRDRLARIMRNPAGVDGNGRPLHDTARVRDVIASLLHLLRVPVNGSPAFSFTETEREGRIIYPVRKARVALDGDHGWRSLLILNAGALLAAGGYPAGLPVFRRPDLPDMSDLLELHVIRVMPTKTALKRRMNLTMETLHHHVKWHRHSHVLVCTDSGGSGLGEVAGMIGALRRGENLEPVEMVHLGRGRIRGSNKAGSCTLAFMSPMPLFTTVEDYALRAALLRRQTLPVNLVHDFGKEGAPPIMSRGRFSIPEMQRVFMLSALGEIQQSVWRAAVRNGVATEVVLVLQDEKWMTVLWSTVMPGAQVVSAIAELTKAETAALKAGDTAGARGTGEPGNVVPAGRTGRGQPVAFKVDRKILGLQTVVNMRAGETIGKGKLALLLGFGSSGKNAGQAGPAWKNNKVAIRELVQPWLEECTDHGNSTMVRRGAGAAGTAQADPERADIVPVAVDVQEDAGADVVCGLAGDAGAQGHEPEGPVEIGAVTVPAEPDALEVQGEQEAVPEIGEQEETAGPEGAVEQESVPPGWARGICKDHAVETIVSRRKRSGKRKRKGLPRYDEEEKSLYDVVRKQIREAGQYVFHRGGPPHPGFKDMVKAADHLISLLFPGMVVLSMRDQCLYPFRVRALERGVTLAIPDDEGRKILLLDKDMLTDHKTGKSKALIIGHDPFDGVPLEKKVNLVVVACTAWSADREQLWTLDQGLTARRFSTLHDSYQDPEDFEAMPGPPGFSLFPRDVEVVCLAADQQEVDGDAWPGNYAGHKARLVITPTRIVELG